jgi:drug/metabolite transporter (DMT)-like permease
VVASATCYSLYQIMTRRISAWTVRRLSAILSSTVGAFVMILVLPFVWKTPVSARDIAMFCSMGVLGALGIIAWRAR